jgi:hypothetical protein
LRQKYDRSRNQKAHDRDETRGADVYEEIWPETAPRKQTTYSCGNRDSDRLGYRVK